MLQLALFSPPFSQGKGPETAIAKQHLQKSNQKGVATIVTIIRGWGERENPTPWDRRTAQPPAQSSSFPSFAFCRCVASSRDPGELGGEERRSDGTACDGEPALEVQFWGQLFLSPREPPGAALGSLSPFSPPPPHPLPPLSQRSAPESRAELPEGDGEQRGIGRRFGSQHRAGWEQRAPADGSAASFLLFLSFFFFVFFFFFSLVSLWLKILTVRFAEGG